MFGMGTEVLVSDFLWLLVILGWVVLILIGLEADKPLSGGLPSHSESVADGHMEEQLTALDRLGIGAAWLLFGGMSLSLPAILWWIFAVHGR
jgi:hypothetical protein